MPREVIVTRFTPGPQSALPLPHRPFPISRPLPRPSASATACPASAKAQAANRHNALRAMKLPSALMMRTEIVVYERYNGVYAFRQLRAPANAVSPGQTPAGDAATESRAPRALAARAGSQGYRGLAPSAVTAVQRPLDLRAGPRRGALEQHFHQRVGAARLLKLHFEAAAGLLAAKCQGAA